VRPLAPARLTSDETVGRMDLMSGVFFRSFIAVLTVAVFGCSGSTSDSSGSSTAGAAGAPDASYDAAAETSSEATPSVPDSGGLIDCTSNVSLCPQGQACKSYCGNGWCKGVCLPNSDCRSDSGSCSAGQQCVERCNTDGWCAGFCETVPDAGPSNDDCRQDAAICNQGEQCVVVCGNGSCAGYCATRVDGG
jgi:hypothetical protein